MYDNAEAKVVFMNGDYRRAAQMFHEGAREGNIEAAFNYGYCLLHGKGVERDPTEAKSFFAFSSELSGGEAAYNLAVMYIEGIGVCKNFKRAVEYMHNSARLGCVEAQLYLGAVYTLGAVIDPEIVSISLIPYHTPEYRSEILLLEGEVSEDAVREEEERLAAVRQNPSLAFEFFRSAARNDPTYTKELVAKGVDVKFEDVLSEMNARDHADSTRAAAPLKPADDAHYFDNSDYDFDGSVEYIIKLIEDKTGVKKIEE